MNISKRQKDKYRSNADVFRRTPGQSLNGSAFSVISAAAGQNNDQSDKKRNFVLVRE